jgi:antitoxin Phd
MIYGGAVKSSWPMQDAKNRLCELVERAATEGPQTITKHGREAAIVISMRDFKRMAAPSGSLMEFFRKSPLFGVELDLSRPKDVGREVPL